MRWGPWGFGWNGPHQEPPPFWCKPKRGSCTHTGPHTPRSVPGVHFEPLQTRPVWKRANTTISRSEPPWSRHNHSKVLASRLFYQSGWEMTAKSSHFRSGKEMQVTLNMLREPSHDPWGAWIKSAHRKVFHASMKKLFRTYRSFFFFYTCTFPSGE